MSQVTCVTSEAAGGWKCCNDDRTMSPFNVWFQVNAWNIQSRKVWIGFTNVKMCHSVKLNASDCQSTATLDELLLETPHLWSICKIAGLECSHTLPARSYRRCYRSVMLWVLKSVQIRATGKVSSSSQVCSRNELFATSILNCTRFRSRIRTKELN